MILSFDFKLIKTNNINTVRSTVRLFSHLKSKLFLLFFFLLFFFKFHFLSYFCLYDLSWERLTSNRITFLHFSLNSYTNTTQMQHKSSYSIFSLCTLQIISTSHRWKCVFLFQFANSHSRFVFVTNGHSKCSFEWIWCS